MNVDEISSLNGKQVKVLEERFYTVKELSEYFRVSERTVRNWIKDGSIESYKVGRMTRVSEEQLNSYLESIKTKH